jgi:arylsulfatase A-like enzyme
MRTMACVVAMALMLGGIQSEATTAAELPNIVFIISDDHDPAQLGFLGDSFVHTPTLDGLARAGAVFTTAHLPMSRCHPTLASFLSGRWPHQSGIYYNYGREKLDPHNSLANLLRDAGYATYVGGKYWEGDPDQMGFTAAFTQSREFVRNGQEDLFRFVDRHAGRQPMFLWWAPLLPHTPHNPPGRFLDLYDWDQMPVPPWMQGRLTEAASEPRVTDPSGEGSAAPTKPAKKKARARSDWRHKEQLSYAMVAWLDEGLGELVRKLREVDQYDNTLFVFVIDNGWCNGLVSKGSPFEKGVATPIFFSFPGRPDLIRPGQRFDGLVSTLDLYPTILAYAGVTAPQSAAGRNLRPVIDGVSGEFRDRLYGAIYPAFATADDQNPERDIYALYARTERWKYILWLQDVRQARNGDYFRIQAIETQYPERDRGSFDLYDLVADPYEQRNLADDPQHAELVARFRQDVLDWWQETGGKPLRPGGQAWP